MVGIGEKSGRKIERIFKVGKSKVFFMFCKCHFVFILLLEGNKIKDIK